MKKEKKVKKMVIDTNVLLHDYRSIYKFEEHDIYIPGIVLTELDSFKKGEGEINYNAREVGRELDQLNCIEISSDGVSLGENLGRLFIIHPTSYHQKLISANYEKTADHLILSTALQLQDEGNEIVLVTKDSNLRSKAFSFGVIAEDYKNDAVKDVSKLYANTVHIKFSEQEAADFYTKNNSNLITEESIINQFSINQHVQIDTKLFARKTVDGLKVIEERKLKAFGIFPKNTEQIFTMDALLDRDISLVALTGKSGTGKTLLALAAALQQNDDYKQILLARPIVALSNKDLGALPGDEKQKIAPYMQPFFDNLGVIKGINGYQGKEVRVIEELQKNEKLVIEALAYIRGRSLGETFFIIDEAQNLTPHEVKAIITRAGEGTKIVFTGDPQQIDNPYLDIYSNGLSYLIAKMRGQKVFVHVNLLEGERSYLAELAANIL